MKIAPKEKANLVCIWKNEEEKPQTKAKIESEDGRDGPQK